VNLRLRLLPTTSPTTSRAGPGVSITIAEARTQSVAARRSRLGHAAGSTISGGCGGDSGAVAGVPSTRPPPKHSLRRVCPPLITTGDLVTSCPSVTRSRGGGEASTAEAAQPPTATAATAMRPASVVSFNAPLLDRRARVVQALSDRTSAVGYVTGLHRHEHALGDLRLAPRGPAPARSRQGTFLSARPGQSAVSWRSDRAGADQAAMTQEPRCGRCGEGCCRR
jgi:hypothetical protein